MNILIVAAHPDDEVLGAGGLYNKYLNEGCGVINLIIGKGRGDALDQKFDTLPITDFIGQIEQEIEIFCPSIVYTHFGRDINKDHQIVHEACRIACRPTKSTVKALYAFDSTLSPMASIYPTHYVTLSREDINQKVEKMKVLYKAEMNASVRTERGIITQASYWGSKIGVDYAEAFETIFDISQ